MSGGAYDYAYWKVRHFAEEMRSDSPLRKRFQRHLEKVADAMRAIEWVDSDDYAPGAEDGAIKKALRADVKRARRSDQEPKARG